MARIDGIAAAAIGAGGLLCYAAVKGYSIPKTVQTIIAGNSPASQSQANPITTPTGPTGTTAAGIPATGVGSGAMAAVLGGYSNSQLQSLWIMAGGNPARAAVAACIADHESSGNPKATSSNPDGGTNVGLWQLDTPGGKGAGYSVAQLMDPVTNAKVAIAGSSNGADWSAWATAPDCGV